MDVLSHHVDCQFDYVETKQKWLEGELTRFFASHVYHHPVPFPPPYRQQGDAVGPYGTQKHDDEDDEWLCLSFYFILLLGYFGIVELLALWCVFSLFKLGNFFIFI